MSSIRPPANPPAFGDTDEYVITAPVEIPTQEQMKVKLVPHHLLTRFDEEIGRAHV